MLVRDLFCFVLFNFDFYISLNFSSNNILLLVLDVDMKYDVCVFGV